MGQMRPLPSALAPADASFATTTHPQAASSPPSLKILHILRAPLGGLFRHVIDLVQGQAQRGHQVGLFIDSTTGGARAETILAELAPCLALGFERAAIPRELNLRDIYALRRVARRIAALRPDVLHGHGAKGAALARLVPNFGHAIRAYTPHGGSLVYCPGTISGGFYRSVERILNWRTDLFLFESSYVADLFRAKIGTPRAMVRIVRNGVGKAEFEPVAIQPDATDIVCVGELRPVKAIDVLIEALAILKSSGRPVTATIVGEGPDDFKLKAQAERLGLAEEVRFVGFRPAREAFAMGRMLVIPSRAEFAALRGARGRGRRRADHRHRGRRRAGDFRARGRASHPARRHRRAGRGNARGVDRSRRSASDRRAGPVAGPCRIFAQHHGRRWSLRLSRGAGVAKTCSIHITKF